ncbi:DUF1344 domain-containing protein [Arvimicrobium flavum]|uniref:DUF1344 domain-containing protein n=1 Tax=Arvimicrobium flavum TaxID=3393320 RepID=UPI00237A1A88|nr:DUF1344 domain-containing protein [Mesorhizobium shangrilense]
MRTLLIPAAAAAILATTAFGFAAATHTSGVVKSIDKHAMTLTLADGSVYNLKKGFKDPGLKAGEKVQISWDMSGSKKIAEQVTISK